jgi:hypothetical protein
VVLQATSLIQAIHTECGGLGYYSVKLVRTSSDKYFFMGVVGGLDVAHSGLLMFENLRGKKERVGFYCPFIDHLGLKQTSTQ